MTKLKRVFNILLGLLIIGAAILLITEPEPAVRLIILVLCASFALKGIGALIYYVRMARFMVGGHRILYKGVVFLDFGLLTITITNIPSTYVMVYLLICMVVSGGINILRAREAKKLESPEWKFKMFYGAFNIIMPVVCLFFISYPITFVLVYAVGLIIGAVNRIAVSLKRGAIIYIQ